MSHRSHSHCRLAGLGMVNGLGRSLEEIWVRLIAGEQCHFTARDDLVPGVVGLFGQVPGDLPEVSPALRRYSCRNNRLALAALEMIRDSVEDAVSRFGAERIGVLLGSSTSGLAEGEQAVRKRVETGSFPTWFDLVQLEFSGLSEFIAHSTGAKGPCYTLSTACSSGAKALVSARALLELGVCDAIITGAVDSLCRLTANGFRSLQVVSEGLTNPMSRNRTGLTIGEGAAVFLMTKDPGGIQLLGAGESSDAHHMSAPDPEGKGAELCMRSALADAGIEADAIAYLNLHGTGTLQNDVMESAAVVRVFGTRLPCSSTKPLVGHALGASGAIEIAFCWMMLARRQGTQIELPPHRWDGEEDPAVAPLALVREGAKVDLDGTAALMSNSFGFGGSNCAVIIGDENG